MYWPGMQAAIKDTCSSCAKCAMFSHVNTCESMLTQPVAEHPWQFVSQDLCEFESRRYLITVDHYSDYIEVDQLYDTKSTTVVEKSKTQFARHGIPDLLLTDNRPHRVLNLPNFVVSGL